MARIAELIAKVESNIRIHDKVGVAISGGLDSSSILHEVCKRNANVNTYTLRWNENCLEGDTAKELSKAYGTTHTEIRFDPERLVETITLMMFAFDRPRWNLWPLWIVESCLNDGVKHLYVGEGADEILGYTDRSYLNGWISQLEYILPVWKTAGTLLNINIHAPFLEVEMNTGLPATLPYHVGKEELWKCYKDDLKAKVIYPKRPELRYYEIIKNAFGWHDVKKELLKRACIAWANTH